jgi:hypothetical protein
MKFATIGAGIIGQALAAHIVRAGHDVTLPNSRGLDSLTDVVAGLGRSTKSRSRVSACTGQVSDLSAGSMRLARTA